MEKRKDKSQKSKIKSQKDCSKWEDNSDKEDHCFLLFNFDF